MCLRSAGAHLPSTPTHTWKQRTRIKHQHGTMEGTPPTLPDRTHTPSAGCPHPQVHRRSSRPFHTITCGAPTGGAASISQQKVPPYTLHSRVQPSAPRVDTQSLAGTGCRNAHIHTHIRQADKLNTMIQATPRCHHTTSNLHSNGVMPHCTV